jgi:ParB family chromosome partitioning protein
MPDPRQALGKGLGALIPAPRYENLSDDYFLCPIEALDVDPDQPREHFDEQAMAELMESIREKGILQPLIVRAHPGQKKRYIVIAGERRLRAARGCRLPHVPVLLKDVTSDEILELALIENIQREDLNAIEEARAYHRLMQRAGMTQDTLSHRIGKSRSAVANSMRLLQLDSSLQTDLLSKRLTTGHARTLLSVPLAPQRRELADRIIADTLTVREAERLVRQWKRQDSAPRTKKRSQPLQPYCETIAEELRSVLGTDVDIRVRGRRGRLVIHFGGIDTLRKIRDRLTVDRG